MAKESYMFDMWVDKGVEPLESIQAEVGILESPDLLGVGANISPISSSMVRYWDIMDQLYGSYREQMVNEPSTSFRLLIDQANLEMVKQLKYILMTMGWLGLNCDFIRVGLERVLSEQNLKSLYDPNNIIQSLLQYGNHVLIFKQSFPIRMAVELEVDYSDPLDRRKACRKLGLLILEESYKTSNEIFLHTKALEDLSNQALSSNSEVSDDAINKIQPTLFRLILAWATHWNLQGADSLYIYTKTYDLVKG